jgi:hypothetical protein
MKTLQAWHSSGLSLIEYLQQPCEIDEGLYNYIGEVVAPKYCSNGLIQLGEPHKVDDVGISYHVTAIYVDHKYFYKYFYIGVLPEFYQK